MDIQQRQVIIKQKIRDPEGQEEIFEYETQVNYFQMRKFHKILYRDYQDLPVEIKCYPGEALESPLIELNQKYGSLRFSLLEKTQNLYQVGPVQTQLDILTEELAIDKDERLDRLYFSYQLLQDEIPLGDYEFQLIFIDEEGKI